MRLRVEQRLADRQQARPPCSCFGRPLGLRDRRRGWTPGVSPNRSSRTGSSALGGKTSITPPRIGELAALGDGGGAEVAVDGEIGLQVGRFDALAGRGARSSWRRLTAATGRHAAEPGRRNCSDQAGTGALVVQAADSRRQRRHPLGRNPRRGPHAVVRQAVPAPGNISDLDVEPKKRNASAKADKRLPSRATNTDRPFRARTTMSAITRWRRSPPARPPGQAGRDPRDAAHLPQP